jgi:hypothetical protein
VFTPIGRGPTIGASLGGEPGYVDSLRFLLRAHCDKDECLSPSRLAPAVTPKVRMAMTRRIVRRLA